MHSDLSRTPNQSERMTRWTRYHSYARSMTFANVGSLGVVSGMRDQVVAILTRLNQQLGEAGCLLYEVGVSDDQPDTVFVMELWDSANAHQASLRLASVQAAIAEAKPLLSGQMSGTQFIVNGSPLRDR